MERNLAVDHNYCAALGFQVYTTGTSQAIAASSALCSARTFLIICDARMPSVMFACRCQSTCSCSCNTTCVLKANHQSVKGSRVLGMQPVLRIPGTAH